MQQMSALGGAHHHRMIYLEAPRTIGCVRDAADDGVEPHRERSRDILARIRLSAVGVDMLNDVITSIQTQWQSKQSNKAHMLIGHDNSVGRFEVLKHQVGTRNIDAPVGKGLVSALVTRKSHQRKSSFQAGATHIRPQTQKGDCSEPLGHDSKKNGERGRRRKEPTFPFI